MLAEESGIEFCATESAESFLKILESHYARDLRDRAHWVVKKFGAVDDACLRERMREISSHWSEEFEFMQRESEDEI